MYLTAEEIELGKRNFLTALGSLRREFLEKSLPAGSVGGHYFGYGSPSGGPVRAGIVGTGNEGCEALIQQSSPAYLEYVAYHDIRPSQIARARNYFHALYGATVGEKVKFYAQWQDMLADKNVEAIVIATPLWTHAKLAIDAMKAGKHVLCEKLIARNVKDAKRMVRTANETKRLLAVGHQRHYSPLYDHALFLVRSGILGEIRHIRAMWHRNNTFPALQGSGLNDGWSPPVPEEDRKAVDSGKLDLNRYGYRSLEHLVRWRLYDDTGGGLMAELGSHQLDACSLFLNKVHPRLVSAVGGKYFFHDDRECEDHVYCTYELPGDVVVTYSSINTNALDGYGEIVTGTKGTLMVMNERDAMLFREREAGDAKRAQETPTRVDLTAESAGANPKLAVSTSLTAPSEAALAQLALERAMNLTVNRPDNSKLTMVDRGYRGEMEAFAFAVRNPGAPLRCDGRVALADAVMALTANVAMRTRRRIAFNDAWYDPRSDEAPDGNVPKLSVA
jgi:predicted dehydrogenase